MVVESLAFVLRRIVGEQLKRSFNQEVWRDDRTWRELAGGVTRALASHYVIIAKSEYRKLAADAEQMRLIRRNVDEYKARTSKEKQVERIRNPYARWAAEHMGGGS